MAPAVHKLRSDVSQVFERTLGAEPGNDDVYYLARTQREATRPLILNADAGLTGANFAVAETGAFVVCTNEAPPISPPMCRRCTSPPSASRS